MCRKIQDWLISQGTLPINLLSTKSIPEDLGYAFPLYNISSLLQNHRLSSNCRGQKAYNLQFIQIQQKCIGYYTFYHYYSILDQGKPWFAPYNVRQRSNIGLLCFKTDDKTLYRSVKVVKDLVEQQIRLVVGTTLLLYHSEINQQL